MNFRQQIKREIATKIFELKIENQEQEIERNELGLRLLQFFEYEQDPEFVTWFNDFCHKKKWERKQKEEKEER